MENPTTLSVIEANRSEAQLLGIKATPTFVIGPTRAEHRHQGTVIEGALPGCLDVLVGVSVSPWGADHHAHLGRIGPEVHHRTHHTQVVNALRIRRPYERRALESAQAVHGTSPLP